MPLIRVIIFLSFFSTISEGFSCGAALSLLEVRKEAQKNGVTFVVDPSGRRIKGQSEREKLLYGASVIHVRDSKPPDKPKKLDGVVIYLGDAHHLSKFYRGKIDL